MSCKSLNSNCLAIGWIALLSIIALQSFSSHPNCQQLPQQQQQQYKKTQEKPNNDSNQTVATIEELLSDTSHSLDILDRKVFSVGNRTADALMRDSLRLFVDDDHNQDKSQVKPADKQVGPETASKYLVESEGGDDYDDDDSSSLGLPIDTVSKRARQIVASALGDDQFVANDSTERHLKFTLNLMQAIFDTQAYSAKNNLIDSFLISPLSLQMVLMMMHLGSRGQTRRELNACLHLTNTNSPNQQADQQKASFNNQQVDSNKPPPRRQQQQQANGGNNQQQLSGNVHELFGNSVRKLLKDPNVVKAFTSANQIFLQKNIALNQQYELAIKHFYGTDIKLVDFPNQKSSSVQNYTMLYSPMTSFGDGNLTSSKESSLDSSQNHQQQNNVQSMINDWVEKQTRGHISNFLTSPVSPSTLMMAINVLYFKGDWKYKFDTADTQTDALFTRSNGETVRVPMMVHRLPIGFAHDVAMKTSVIELPYKAQRLGLFLLLPDEVAGIYHTIKMLNSTSFAHLISSMRKPSSGSSSSPSLAERSGLNGGINVRIPRFKIDSSPRLTQILSQQLGLKTLFSPDMADLSGMFASFAAANNKHRNNAAQNFVHQKSSTSGNISASQQYEPLTAQVSLDELIHKAVLQVDEQGSIAAASSATIVERVGIFNNNYFEADHPFLLFLMDKQTGLVLFSGVFAGNK